MKQKIIINADSYETRIAILEDDELAELFVERAEQRRHVGDIYKGRVNAVLPGMQAAFVDLGLPKTGFLHASDLAESLSELEDISDLDEARRPRAAAGARRCPRSRTTSRRARRSWSRSPRSRSAPRARASPSRSACRAASAC